MITIMAGMLWLVGAVGAAPAVLAPIAGTLQVAAGAEVPALDGNLGAPAWKAAGTVKGEGWTMYAVATARTVHLGVELSDPGLAEGPVRRDGDAALLDGDALVLALGDGEEEGVPTIAVDLKGQKGQWLVHPQKNARIPWVGGWKVKTQWDAAKKRWSVTGSLPRWAMGHEWPSRLRLSVLKAGKPVRQARIELRYHGAFTYERFLRTLRTAKKAREITEVFREAVRSGLIVFVSNDAMGGVTFLGDLEDEELEERAESLADIDPEDRKELPIVGWLGIHLNAVPVPEDADLPDDQDDEPSTGIQAADVIPEGTAERVGLEGGDIIVRINGERIRSTEDCVKAIQGMPPGSITVFDVLRGGEGKPERLAMALGACLRFNR